MLIAAIVFAVITAVIFGSYYAFVLRPEGQEDRALRQRLKSRAPSESPGTTVVRKDDQLSAVKPLDRVLRRWQQPDSHLSELIAQSGMSTTIGAFILASVLCALVGLLATIQLTSSFGIGLAVSAVAALVPYFYLRRKAASRLATFEEQFPDAIDLLARSLRAGHALPTALQNVADEIPDPVGGEFKVLFDQQNYGMTLPEALRAFAVRVPVLDARFFVTAVLTQRETGGNLSEVLDNLSAVIRERFKVKRHVRVVSAHGRITGVVLGFLPPVLAFILFLISPEHIGLLWTDPLGFNMLLVGLFLQVLGVLIIRRIVDVEY